MLADIISAISISFELSICTTLDLNRRPL